MRYGDSLLELSTVWLNVYIQVEYNNDYCISVSHVMPACFMQNNIMP